MKQSIRGYTDGVIEQVRDGLAQTAGELAAVRDLVARSENLRQALVDPGVAMASRRVLLTDLLTGKVGDPTLRLLSYVISSDRAGDVADDIEWLALRVDAAAQDRLPIGEATLGPKAAEERLEGFTTAVLETLSAERDLIAVEDDLFRFLRLLQGSPELRQALSSRDTAPDARRRIVVDLLQQKTNPATVRLAAYATQIGRPRDYERLLALLVDRIASENNRRVAEVRSATELDDNQRQRLAAALTRIAGRQVDIRVSVDESVIGGFVATIGDTIVDGSARHKLEMLKERLEVPEAALTVGPSGNIATTGEPTDG